MGVCVAMNRLRISIFSLLRTVLYVALSFIILYFFASLVFSKETIISFVSSENIFNRCITLTLVGLLAGYIMQIYHFIKTKSTIVQKKKVIRK